MVPGAHWRHACLTRRVFQDRNECNYELQWMYSSLTMEVFMAPNGGVHGVLLDVFLGHYCVLLGFTGYVNRCLLDALVDAKKDLRLVPTVPRLEMLGAKCSVCNDVRTKCQLVKTLTHQTVYIQFILCVTIHAHFISPHLT